MINNERRTTPKAHVHFQTMTKTPAKFPNVWYKTVRGVEPTSYQCHRITTKNNQVEKSEKLKKDNDRIIKKPNAHLQTM